VNGPLRAYLGLTTAAMLAACNVRGGENHSTPLAFKSASPTTIHLETPTSTPTFAPTRTRFPRPPAGVYIAFTVVTGLQGDTPIRQLSIKAASSAEVYVLARDIYSGSVSPDGRLALFFKADGLHAMSLLSGSQEAVTGSGTELSLQPRICAPLEWSRSSAIAASICGAPFADYSLLFFNPADGTLRQTPLPLACFDFDLSSDGITLLATCFDPDRGDVVAAIPTDGAPPAVLSCPQGLICNRPKLSPDGRYIAFFSGEGRSGVPSMPFGIFIRETTCLTQTSNCSSPTQGPIAESEHWAWSPDASLIAFIDDQGRLAIYDLAPKTTQFIGQTGITAHAIEWSPDGEWIAVATDSDISLFSPDGTTRKTVASGELIELAGWATFAQEK